MSAMIKAVCLSSALFIQASIKNSRSYSFNTASVSDDRLWLKTVGGVSMPSVLRVLALLHAAEMIYP